MPIITILIIIGVQANFLGGGAEPTLPENVFDSARKTAMPTSKIAFPDSPYLISKNPGFRALFLARRNEFRFFRFCPKNNGFAAVRRHAPPGSYDYANNRYFWKRWVQSSQPLTYLGLGSQNLS